MTPAATQTSAEPLSPAADGVTKGPEGAVPESAEIRDPHGHFLRLAWERLREHAARIGKTGEKAADETTAGSTSAEGLEFPSFPSRKLPAAVVLGGKLRLTPFETWTLILAAGMDMDAPLAAMMRKMGGHLSFDLCCRWLPGAHQDAFAPEAPLRRLQLLHVPADWQTGPLKVQERVLNYLLGQTCQEPRLVPYYLGHARPGLPFSALQGRISRIEAWVKGEVGKGLALVLAAEPQADLAACLHHAANANDYRLIRLDPAILQSDREALSHLVGLLHREVLLERVIFYLETPATPPQGFWDQAGSFMNRVGDSTVLIAAGSVESSPGDCHLMRFNPLTRREQADLWLEGLPADPEGRLTEAVAEVASTFRVPPGRIQAVQASLRKGPPVTREILWKACREAARPQHVPGVEWVAPKARWEDLVLPPPQTEALRSLCGQVKHRLKVLESWGFAARSARGLGLSAIFTGSSGTGKTMAAEAIAGELGLDLYIVDLSRVVSKYIGETEKNLAALFDAAENSGAVLLFDEADALFGKRTEVKDSHDRYANIEVSYLLQRMESYTGLSILTSNLKNAIDEAFLRRIRLAVAFPFPDARHRRLIWERVFPIEAPREGLDYDRLAQLNVAGGNIRNIALCAAFVAAEEGAAAIGMRHVLQAARWEFQKLEKPLTDHELKGWGKA